jgi:hypothetical protein
MKKLFLLPVIALFIVIPLVSLVSACDTNRECAIENTCSVDNRHVCNEYCGSDRTCHESCPIDCSPNSCINGQCVPEFTSLGMGIAIAGAGVGYALIRRKLKK